MTLNINRHKNDGLSKLKRKLLFLETIVSYRKVSPLPLIVFVLQKYYFKP